MQIERKPSSPTRDALRLLLRNPSALLALVMILALAVVAVSGSLFTGRAPTPEERDRLAESREIGSTVNIDVNPRSIADPGRTELADKLKSPFSRSEVDDERIYYLGTDHLGRDIAAQLWAGSSISLTIGFLAVGISVLLGVALGGIAGYFGRQRVRLPLLVSLLLALCGGIAIPAEAPRTGTVLLVLAAVVFVFQCIVAVLGRRFQAVACFAGACVAAGAVFGYNSFIEHSTPEGERLQHARGMASSSKDVLLQLRDLSDKRVRAESGAPGAESQDFLLVEQLRFEIAERRLKLQEARLEHNQFVTGLEIEERSIAESLAWADHLEAVTDMPFASGTKPQEEQAAARYDRVATRLRLASSTRTDATARRQRLERIRASIPRWIEQVESALEAADEQIALPPDTDLTKHAGQLRLMLQTHVALLRVDYARAMLDAAVALADAEAELPESDWQTGASAEVKTFLDSARQLRQQAQNEADPIASQDLGTRADGADMVAEAMHLRLIGEARLAQLKEGGDGRLISVLQSALQQRGPRQEPGPVGRAQELGSAIQAAPDKSAGLLSDWNKDGDTRKALMDYDYGIENRTERDPLFFMPESSNRLLNRRAQFRANYLKKYDALSGQLFDGSAGIMQVTRADGSKRYWAYRISRHFLCITAVILLLAITGLAVAGSAQAAAGDLKGPVGKLFLPTITVDDLVMRFTEIMMTIPVIFLILAVLALFERDVYIVMGVIGLTSWMGMTRFVRAEILSLREQDFIQAARSLGVSDFRIIWRHLVPNAISPVLVSATIGVATAVLAESTLSFLGIGAGPDQHTWGQILSNGRAYIADAPWMTWIPGVAILITVLSFNLLGEGLREAFNPKLRGR